MLCPFIFFFFSSRRRHTRYIGDWSSDVCSSDLRSLFPGGGGTATGNKDLRLPDTYQLPIVLVLNDRSASDTEIFALSLKENNRATIVGQKTVGCLGSASPNHFSDGAELAVAVEELVGAQTGAKYNNVGIPPDVQADDATA